MEKLTIQKATILIIEDNADTRKFLEAILSKEFQVLTAENAILGIEFARNKGPDLILLDIMLPNLSGFDACNLLKKDEKTNRIPIIFLSAKNSVANITQGLSAGADDYMAKPFDAKELLARIKVRLRKTTDDQSQHSLVIGDLKIDQANREITFEGKKTQLTLTEFDILRYLATQAGTPVSRDLILKEVWRAPSEELNDRTIDVHIRALRKKIPPLSTHIVSIYGVGYKYVL